MLMLTFDLGLSEARLEGEGPQETVQVVRTCYAAFEEGLGAL